MGEITEKPKVAFSVTNCICFDQRVLKMSGCARDMGCEVTIIGRKKRNCFENQNVPFRTKRFRMLFNKGFLFYKFFNIRLFIYLLLNRFDILVANDLDTLLPNYLVSRLRGIQLVYDSHEYFTGVPELNGRPFVRWVWKEIERYILPKLQYVITVSDHIAELYINEYGIKPAVIRNLANSSESVIPYNRKELGVPENHFLLIIQGAGINIDKGAEELIEAIAMTENVSLIIAGSGDVIPDLKNRVNRLLITERVKFFQLMSWKELMRYTKSADAGMSLEKDTNLNYRFSLPNKLFDYISAGIPVISGGLPEIKKVIETYECGLIISEITPENISKAVTSLRDNKDLLNKLKQNSALASKTLNWENESQKVTSFYRTVLMELH